MNYQSLFAGTPGTGNVRAGLIGAGQFGLSLVTQARVCERVEVPALCDRDVSRAVRVLCDAGYARDDIEICSSARDAVHTLEVGKQVVVEDASLLMGLPLDLIVEATGDADAGAGNAAAAIEHGKHVAMVTKEADSVVGAVLHARAHAADLVYTPVDGDQPGLLMGLVSWARLLGFRIVAAGKSSEYDFVFDPADETIAWRDRGISVPGFGRLWNLGDDPSAALAERAEALVELPQRTVPDLCEMGMVCNATGMRPDTPGFHVPIVRTVEVPRVLCLREHGGILESSETVDVFNCLRRPDEASFAGGVFVIVACGDPGTWRALREKGIPMSEDNRHAMLYNPQHLLGLEAPMSLLQAVLLKQSALGAPKPRVCELVARTTRAFRAGDVLEVTDHHHHEVGGLTPLLVAPSAVASSSPLPYYMAVGRRLVRDVAAGNMIVRDDVEPPADSTLWRLRAEQDRLEASRERIDAGGTRS